MKKIAAILIALTLLSLPLEMCIRDSTSEPDVGTCVEIRMPRIREGDYETK